MTWLTRVRVWLRQLFRRAAAEERMDEEICFHLELETEKNIRTGMSPAEARRRARIAFGGVETYRVQLRDERRLVLLEDFWLDLRYALRALRRNASWATFAVVIVGLGVGASVTVFSLLQALLLRPLPFHEPDGLVWISNGDAHDLSARTVQVRHVWTLLGDSRSLEDVAGYSEFYGAGDHHLIGSGEPERLTGIEVTQNFFPLLGVQPQLGRGFSDEESTEGGPDALLLSHALWARRFGSDPDIVGQAITLDGAPVTVAGVLPADFDFGTVFAPGRRIDFFSPFPLSAERNRQGNTLALVARLAPGVTVETAQRELSTFAVPDVREVERYNSFRPLVRGLREHVSGAFRPAMLVLAGAVGLVMLIVCANLSNLLLARTTTRENEMALRAALGAGRARLIRQLLTESLLLASGGTVLGVLLGVLGTRVLSHMDALSLPLLDRVRVDWTTLGFAAATALLTGIVFGLLPALRVSAPALHESLKAAGRGSSAGRRHAWVRDGLVVTEVALACMLLVGAGLLMRSFLRVLDVDLGFQPQGTVAVRIDPNASFPSPEARSAYYGDALTRVRAAPGIETAGVTDVLPFGFNRMWNVSSPGQSYAPEQRPDAYVRIVSDGYLAAMGIPTHAGRDFTARDDASSRPVIIINDALARTLWPGENPLGRMISTGGQPDREVVGVVAGTRHQTLENEAGPEFYIPMRQTRDYSAVHVVARGTLPAAGILSAVRSALRPMDSTLPMSEVRVIQELVERSVSPRRIIVLLLAGFASLALILAALGIYSVISYGVTRRRREIGIRIALGESAAALQWRILTQTMVLATAGMIIGLAGSWALGRMLQGLLFGVSFTDSVSFVAALAMITFVAALAGYLPARRAARIDPMEALRAA